MSLATNGEHTIGDILRPATEVVQTEPNTPTVDRMLSTFDKQWTRTADDCIKRAQELETAAIELRKRAEDLLSARNWLDDVKQTVLFEIESRNRSASLALVNPSTD